MMDACSTKRLNSSCNDICILISTSCAPDIPFVIPTVQLFTVSTKADWPTEVLLKAHILHRGLRTLVYICAHRYVWRSWRPTGHKWRPKIVVQHNNMVKSTIKCKAYSWRIDESFICTRIHNHNADSNSKINMFKNLCFSINLFKRK